MLILNKGPARKRDDINAELTGAHTCTSAGITARGSAPVLTLCRELLALGVDPDMALTVYRNATLALKVRSIGEAAKVTIRDDSGPPRLVAYWPPPTERLDRTDKPERRDRAEGAMS